MTLSSQGLFFADQQLRLRKSGLLGAALQRAEDRRNQARLTMASGKNIDPDCTLAYWSSSMMLARGARHVSLAQDAVDVGGRKIELSAVWLPERQRSFWAAPQATVGIPVATRLLNGTGGNLSVGKRCVCSETLRAPPADAPKWMTAVERTSVRPVANVRGLFVDR